MTLAHALPIQFTSELTLPPATTMRTIHRAVQSSADSTVFNDVEIDIKGLPSGNYLVAAVDSVQEDEWFDPQFLQRLRFEGIRMSLTNGESKDLNLALDVPDP